MTPAGWYPDPEAPDVLRWWTGERWTEDFSPMVRGVSPQSVTSVMPYPVIVQQRVYKTSHGFHVIMSLLTFGLWIPVWIIVGITNAARS